jgi:hypothetical protein
MEVDGYEGQKFGLQKHTNLSRWHNTALHATEESKNEDMWSDCKTNQKAKMCKKAPKMPNVITMTMI